MAKYINIYNSEEEYTNDAANRPTISVSFVIGSNKVHYCGSQSIIGDTAREAINTINTEIETIKQTIEPLTGKTIITKIN